MAFDFERKVSVQVNDTVKSPYNFNSIVNEIKTQCVPGELVVLFPGNGGITSVVFKGKAKLHEGEIEVAEPETEKTARTSEDNPTKKF